MFFVGSVLSDFCQRDSYLESEIDAIVTHSSWFPTTDGVNLSPAPVWMIANCLPYLKLLDVKILKLKLLDVKHFLLSGRVNREQCKNKRDGRPCKRSMIYIFHFISMNLYCLQKVDDFTFFILFRWICIVCKRSMILHYFFEPQDAWSS